MDHVFFVGSPPMLTDEEFAREYLQPMVEYWIDQGERAYGVTVSPDGVVVPYDSEAWAKAHPDRPWRPIYPHLAQRRVDTP